MLYHQTKKSLFESLRIFHPQTTLGHISLLLFGVLALAIAAQVSIPFQPVPLTIQSTTVVLIATIYGAKRSASVVSLYLLLGLIGLPVFAGYHAGPAALMGPTGGYLLGFLPTALVCGYLAQKAYTKTWLGAFLSAAVGVSIIFLSGVSHLSLYLGWHEAFIVGALPFLFSEVAKLLAVSWIIKKSANNGNHNA